MLLLIVLCVFRASFRWGTLTAASVIVVLTLLAMGVHRPFLPWSTVWYAAYMNRALFIMRLYLAISYFCCFTYFYSFSCYRDRHTGFWCILTLEVFLYCVWPMTMFQAVVVRVLLLENHTHCVCHHSTDEVWIFESHPYVLITHYVLALLQVIRCAMVCIRT